MPICAHFLSLALAVDHIWADVKPGAVKRGRNPRYPYVPLKVMPDFIGKPVTQQYPNRAFVTRDEALAYARRVIRNSRMLDLCRLVRPECRVYRRQWGLPENLE